MANTICTWADKDVRCHMSARHPHVSTDGRIWANLCDAHHNLVELHCRPDSFIPQMLSTWVKASGGPKVLAASMMK